MSVREKDSSDFDLETFVELFDTAMTSNNPAVRKAFKNLLMISAIVNSEQPNSELRTGPLRRLVDDIRNLNSRINELENQKRYNVTPIPMPAGPTWIGPNITTHPNTTAVPNWPPGSITCAATSSTEETSKLTMAVLEKLENK